MSDQTTTTSETTPQPELRIEQLTETERAIAIARAADRYDEFYGYDPEHRNFEK